MDYPFRTTDNNIDKAGNHAAWQALRPEEKKAFKGAWELRSRLIDGKTLVLIAKPHIDIFHVRRLFVPGVDIKIRITLNEPAFFMNGLAAGGVRPRLNPEDMKMTFHSCVRRLRSDKFNAISTARLQKQAKVYYPTVRSEIRASTIATNATFFEVADVFQGRVPDRLIVGLLHQNAYNGDLAYNPFNFMKFGVKSIKQKVEGEEFPYTKTLELNHDNDEYDMDGYHRLMEAACMDYKQKCMIKPEHWGQDKGTTLFMWDNVTHGCADSVELNPRLEGKLDLQIKFGAPNAHVITALIYGEFENSVEIGPTGSVEYDLYREQLTGRRQG